MDLTDLSPAERDQLAQDDPQVLTKLESAQSRRDDLQYPKPELGEITQFVQTQRADRAVFDEQVVANGDLRYLRDETPKKWAREMEDGRRVRTRKSHNEILRVVANQCRNRPKFDVPASGTNDASLDRARKQTRWLNQLLPAMERKTRKRLRRILVDQQNGDGLGYLEIALTGAYDDLDMEWAETEEVDAQTGQVTSNRESSHSYMQRTESQLRKAGIPFVFRNVHPLEGYHEEDDDGVSRALVVTMKPYRQVYNALRAKKSDEEMSELRLPTPSDPGHPLLGIDTNGNTNGNVETVRYYDRRWYAYLVAGAIVEGPIEHHLPGVPMFPLEGIVTGSPNRAEATEGITWGMSGLEEALNDMLTLGLDSSYTYSKVRPIIETAPGSTIMLDPQTKKPRVIDLSDTRKVTQLNPGQKVVDAYGNFEPKLNSELTSTLLQIWQQNGQNPVAQGQSPGSDPAGYTVNSLMGAAQSHYEICYDNEADVWAAVGDFCRLMIRDTIKQPVYLACPMEDSRQGGTEWLALGPDDVDETPCIVIIDPLSDANRLAERESLNKGWQSGVVPRRILQERGYGAEDTTAWDDEIIREKAIEKMIATLVDNAMLRVRMAEPKPPPAPPAPGITGAPGMPGMDAGGMMPPGAGPAAPQPPTVGAGMNAASQGPDIGGGGFPQIAGQNNGYNPPPGMATPSARG